MADTKLTGLAAITDPQGTDILYIGDDPGGTPASKKITVASLFNLTSDIIPSARVYDASNQSIPDNTATAVEFDSERFDTDTIHNPASNNTRLTCNTTGKYIIHGHVNFATNGTGRRLAIIRLNGTTDIAQYSNNSPGSSFPVLCSVATVYDLAATDYVELVVLQDSTAALNITASGNKSNEFGMVRIGD